ncbi:hypothetical protein GGX14DRAFT_567465 [Mycena pura]|uniref:Uncharacterized protein n=1 Tax=Mycena pura TaxID=153505 RepID=A0AAD6VAL6_9AGAR|nr:hypothetical protein GGX14DRAFT_567465 [Mycena pura]
MATPTLEPSTSASASSLKPDPVPYPINAPGHLSVHVSLLCVGFTMLFCMAALCYVCFQRRRTSRWTQRRMQVHSVGAQGAARWEDDGSEAQAEEKVPVLHDARVVGGGGPWHTAAAAALRWGAIQPLALQTQINSCAPAMAWTTIKPRRRSMSRHSSRAVHGHASSDASSFQSATSTSLEHVGICPGQASDAAAAAVGDEQYVPVPVPTHVVVLIAMPHPPPQPDGECDAARADMSLNPLTDTLRLLHDVMDANMALGVADTSSILPRAH